MIVNYSLQKSPPGSNTLQLSLCNNQNSRSIVSGREKIKSIHQDMNNFSTEKHILANKNQKVEPKQFKIRTCNNKANKNIYSVVGRPINHMLTVDYKEKHKLVTDQQLSNMIIKRMSMADTPQTKNAEKSKQKQLFRPNPKNKDKVFDQIDVFKTIQPTQLEFTSYHMTPLLPLAHKVEYMRNYFDESESALSQKYILIVSFRLLNQERKKYKQSHRPMSSQNIKSQSPFSIETTNLLKSLSGPQSSKSFLNNCKIYYKVNDDRQLTLLEQFLTENNFNHYSGIINVQDKYVESYNLYLLKGIAAKGDSVIFLEDKNTISNQFPILNGQKAIFILPKNHSYFCISQAIDNIKMIELQHACSPLKSQLKKTQITDDSDKENFTPNRYHFHIVRSSSKKQNFASLSPCKKQNKGIEKLSLNGKLTKRSLDINIFHLLQKSECFQSARNIKHFSRNKSVKQEQNRSVSIKNLRDKSLGKKKDCSFEQVKAHLEGDFKDKMVTFIKILQVEKKQRLEKMNSKPSEQRKEAQGDVVEELTNNITSKLKNKTNYQMVGQLLRNNSHIAKQIGKYLQKISPLQESLRDIKQRNDNSSVFPEEKSKPFELMVYDYE